VLAVGGVVLVATLGRLPSLLVVPAFTDEVEEAALGLAIVRDGIRPLTNVDPYIGPLWNYALAGLFWLLGPSIVIPRALVMAAGVLTVLLTYLLGRAWYGRRVGLLGATLLGVSAAHIAVNSHVAWSNCVTPLFTTAGLVVLAHALRDDRPRLLPAAGLLLGLAFHTHPTAAPVLVAAALGVAITRRRRLAGPWPYLAALAGLAVNANLIVYNAVTGGRTFRYAQEIQASYVQETGGPTGYPERLADLLLGLARALSSSLDSHASPLEYAADPLLVIAATLSLAGLALAIRPRARPSPLPLLVVGVSVIALPLVNPKYDPILNVRYLAPILPICLLWVGLALEWLAWRHGRARPVRSALPARGAGPAGFGGWPARLSGASGVVLASLLTTTLVVGSLGALARYYDDVRENYRTGARILELARTARSAGPAGQPVILDERLDHLTLGPGAGILLRVIRLALELDGIPTEVQWLGEERPRQAHDGQLVVLAARSKPRFTAEAVSGLGLRAVNGGSARVHSQASRYGIYRFGPAPASAAWASARHSRGNDAARAASTTPHSAKLAGRGSAPPRSSRRAVAGR
jgi:hypothetical protein